MTKLADNALRLYQRLVLDHAVAVMVCIVVAVGLLGYKARDFRIDASAESILLENDKDLHYSRQISERYGTNDYLLIAMVPKKGELLSDHNLKTIARLRNDLTRLPDVDSVLTVLDVPLFSSPPIAYTALADGIPTLSSAGTDKSLAAAELNQSPFYRQLLVSADMTATAVIVNLKIDQIYLDLISRRTALNDIAGRDELTPDQSAELDRLGGRIRDHLYEATRAQHQNIQAVREIIAGYRSEADLFLGGVSMIQDDMIAFVRNDLRNFGIGVFLLLIVMLGIIFKHPRWIVMPMLSCAFSVTAMMGILALFGWDVTVISSNFISLQLIITLSIAVHLIVRYGEFMSAAPDADQRTLVKQTVSTKFIPCLYAALTTIAGFGSLLLCNIKPVINFGWMMSAGIVLSLLMTFVLFPAFMMLLPKEAPPTRRARLRLPITPWLAGFTERHGTAILVVTTLFCIVTVIGLGRLKVENSFIDYFKESTEIYRGMTLIDQKLGGTTPLDVVVGFEPVDLSAFADLEDEEDDLLNPYQAETSQSYDQYWFFEDRMQVIEQVHDYLGGLPETGKVLSMGTLLKIARTLNNGEPLDSIEMAVLYTKLPDEYKDLILKPYLSIPHDETRFSIRIKDSLPELQRDLLLKRIRNDLVNRIGLAPDKVHLAGTMVMYNNMLQSLFSSQILTIGVVAVALLAMFVILFRSLKLALIALFPNLFSAAFVISVMGWLRIPLDMMTITIASISVGIAVDDTIHYIYRFREEIKKDGDYRATLHRCHGSIGYAMFYTSVTIVIGFSIMALVQFLAHYLFRAFHQPGHGGCLDYGPDPAAEVDCLVQAVQDRAGRISARLIMNTNPSAGSPISRWR